MDVAARGAIERLARPAALAIEPYVWEAANHEIAARYGLAPSDVVRFDTNTAPLPPPCLDAVLDRVRVEPLVNEYFDGSYAMLAQALADYTGFSPEQMVIGAGADEILDIMAKTFLNPGDTVVIPSPTYAVYRIVSQTMDANIRVLPPQPDLSFDLHALAEAAQDAKVIFLCNPNNPTGFAVSAAAVGELVGRVPGLVIVDEAYAEFSGDSALSLVREQPRLIIVRTLSKAFALAGARIGYAICDPEVIGLANRTRPPNSISYISAILAETAVRDRPSMRAAVGTLLAEREWLAAELGRLGPEVFPSVTNFLLTRWPSSQVALSVFETCLRHGLVPRSYPDHPVLARYLRLTVRTREENRRLLDALREALKAPGA